MEVEIAPEPGPRELEALLETLSGLGDDSELPAAYRSRWRRAALDPEPDSEQGPTGRPRALATGPEPPARSRAR